MKKKNGKGQAPEKQKPEQAPLVSIVVLTYLQRHLLEDCIDSVLEQDYPNLELIICDDCSADFDEAGVTEYIEAHKGENLRRFVVYKQPRNVGTVQNAQTAVELSTGVFFKLHAGDDMLSDKTSVSRAAAYLKKPDVEIIAGRSVACEYDGGATEHYYPAIEAIAQMKYADARRQYYLMSGQTWCAFIHPTSVFWRRSLFDEVGGFDTKYTYTEDWHMWLKVTAAGHRILMLEEVFTIFRYGGISTTSEYLTQIIRKTFREEHIRMFREDILPAVTKDGSFIKILRAKHCLRSLKVLRETDGVWDSWSIRRRLLWKIRNADFLLLSWLYRIKAWGVTTKKKDTLMVLGAALALFVLNIKIWPGVACDALWAWLFLVALLVLVIQVGLEYGVKVLKLALEIKKKG